MPLSAVKLDTKRDEVESTIGGQTSCIVCFKGDKSHAAVPCGHRCVCEDCSNVIGKGRCPYCREEVMWWMKVRIA